MWVLVVVDLLDELMMKLLIIWGVCLVVVIFIPSSHASRPWIPKVDSP